MLDITISGGTVVSPSGARVMDVHISGDTIAAVTVPGAEGFEAGRIPPTLRPPGRPGGGRYAPSRRSGWRR